MPGLLQSPEGNFSSAKVVYALIAEFLGTMLFTFAGTTTPIGTATTEEGMTGSGQTSANWQPWGNGFSLAIMVFITANISGGHLNPAVTLATLFTGHMGVARGLAYILAQICGAAFGILMVAGLLPTAYVGMGNSGVGCFNTGDGISLGMLFGWEAVMTFVLVSVVYAVAIGEPSFGIMGPFAIGLALFTMVFSGGASTGAAVNPARALGPAIVFHCHWNKVWLYVIAECVGGVIAGLMAGPLYGVGSDWLKKLMPWIKASEQPKGGNGVGGDNALADQDANKHGDNSESNTPHGDESIAPFFNSKKPKSKKDKGEFTTIV